MGHGEGVGVKHVVAGGRLPAAPDRRDRDSPHKTVGEAIELGDGRVVGTQEGSVADVGFQARKSQRHQPGHDGCAAPRENRVPK